MLRLLQIELYKIFKRPRTFIAFAVIALIIVLVQIALKFGGEEYVGLMLSGVSETFVVPSREILNGYLVCFVILNLLLIHVPILVALIAEATLLMVSSSTLCSSKNLVAMRMLSSSCSAAVPLMYPVS